MVVSQKAQSTSVREQESPSNRYCTSNTSSHLEFNSHGHNYAEQQFTRYKLDLEIEGIFTS